VLLLRDLVTRGGGQVNERSRPGRSLFQLAGAHGHPPLMRALVQLGFDPRVSRVPSRQGTLWLGRERDPNRMPVPANAATLKALLDEFGYSLPESVVQPSTSVSWRCPFDERTKEQLEADSLAVLQLQLERRASPAVQACNPAALLAAESASHAKMLLATGCPVDHREEHHGMTALFLACKQGDVELVRTLLGHGASPQVALWEHEGESSEYCATASQPLLATVHWGSDVKADAQLCITEALVRAGADPLCRDVFGVTALWMALACQEVQVAEVMFAAVCAQTAPTPYALWSDGRDPPESAFAGRPHEDCEPDMEERLPLLHVAAAAGAPTIVEYLLALEGVDVNHPCRECDLHAAASAGGTPLLLACTFGTEFEYIAHHAKSHSQERIARQLRTVQVLLRHSADPLLADCRGNTALHCLAFDSEGGAITNAILSQAGACALQAINRAGHAPAAAAKVSRRPNMAALLTSLAEVPRTKAARH
jgi:ankyrin repeat protein